jgi:hypothetical protein
MRLILLSVGTILILIAVALPALVLLGGGSPRDIHSHREIQLQRRGMIESALFKASFWVADHRVLLGLTGLLLVLISLIL